MLTPFPISRVRDSLDFKQRHVTFNAISGKCEVWHTRGRRGTEFRESRRQLVLTDDRGREACLSMKWVVADIDFGDPNVLLQKLAECFNNASLYTGSRLCYHKGKKLSDPFRAIVAPWWDVYETSALNTKAFQMGVLGEFIRRELVTITSAEKYWVCP